MQDEAWQEARRGIRALAAWLGEAEPETVAAFSRGHADRKARAGRAAVAQGLGLTDAELAAFDVVLREAARRETVSNDAPETERRFAINAALRLVRRLETIAQRLGFDFRSDLEGGTAEQAIRDEVAAARTGLAGLAHDTAAIRADTAQIETGVARLGGRSGFVAGGLGLAAVIGAVSLVLALRSHGDIEQARETTHEVAETTKRMAATVAAMEEDLRALAGLGGLVAEPKTPADFLHNARVLEQRGETELAIEAYKVVLAFGLDLADPVLDVVELVRVRQGAEAASAFVERDIRPLVSDDLYWVAQAAVARDRNPALIAKLQDRSLTYAPAKAIWITISDAHIATATDRALLAAAAADVADSAESGDFRTHFIDPVRAQSVADAALAVAREMRAEAVAE